MREERKKITGGRKEVPPWACAGGCTCRLLAVGGLCKCLSAEAREERSAVGCAAVGHPGSHSDDPGPTPRARRPRAG